MVLLLLAGGSAVLSGERRTRRVLVDVGSGQRQRLRLFGGWVAAPATAMVLAIPLSFAGAAIAGLDAAGSGGWLWLLPCLSGLAGCLVLLAMAIRVPDRVGE